MEKKKRHRPLLRFPHHMKKKLVVLFGAVSIAMIALIVRLIYIENTSGERYEKIVLSQQAYDSQTIPYQRGDIVDSKGTVLATSIAVYNVIMDCSVVTDREEYIAPTITALTSCFPELDQDELYGYVREQPESKYIVLLRRVAYEQVQPFVEMQELEDENGNKVNPNIKGIWFEKEYQRQYPHGQLASAVVGFTASGNVGVNGLENYYNDTLNGINGREYGYLNNDNNFEKTIKQPINGSTLVTTIDANIQSVVEDKIAEFNEAYTNAYRAGEASAKHIGVLVMDPNNGDVLAMANYPNYDLSNPRDLSAYYSEDAIAVMSDEEKMNALNQLWQNFCVSYTYEPGSTAKPFTIASGLETGRLTGNESYYCDGYERVGGHDIHCVNRYGHQMETLEEALMNSCNDALMQISYVIGSDIFTEYQQIFGFGQRTNIDLPGEARTDSLIFTKENMTPIDLATNSFGQNFNTTMIQLASAYCSIINGGYLYQPRVVKRITDEKGNSIQEFTPTLLRQTVSAQTCETLKGYMYSTVSRGTADAAKVDGYSMGGKTGTAQKVPRDGISYLVSFIGFAPMDDPQLVIYCVVDEPNAPEQFHSTFAQNIAREILEEVLPYMNIYRDEESTGIHKGWDIRGEEADQAALTDIVNEDGEGGEGEEGEQDMSGLPIEGDVTDIPDTTGQLPGSGGEGNALEPDDAAAPDDGIPSDDGAAPDDAAADDGAADDGTSPGDAAVPDDGAAADDGIPSDDGVADDGTSPGDAAAPDNGIPSDDGAAQGNGTLPDDAAADDGAASNDGIPSDDGAAQ